MADTLGVCAMYSEGLAVVLVLGADARMPVSVLLIENDPPCTVICSRNLPLCMRGVYVCARVSTNPSSLAFLPTPPPPPLAASSSPPRPPPPPPLPPPPPPAARIEDS